MQGGGDLLLYLTHDRNEVGRLYQGGFGAAGIRNFGCVADKIAHGATISAARRKFF